MVAGWYQCHLFLLLCSLSPILISYFIHFQVHPSNFFDADPEGNGRQRHSKITATVGLVVHAAGKGLLYSTPQG